MVYTYIIVFWGEAHSHNEIVFLVGGNVLLKRLLMQVEDSFS